MAEQNNNGGQQQDINQLIQVRYDKLHELQANGKDPFVITKYKGLDPEVFSGVDNNVYPRPVTFTLGLVATF